jgi:hypothetical protein
MPYQLDQEALDSPNLKILDINKPPTKMVPFEKFPQMVYLHPKDKSKEHLTKTVHTSDEFDDAMEAGWQTTPHIPVEKPVDYSDHFEVKRGPGRPKANAA